VAPAGTRERIAEIIREALAQGHAVEIEGLGTFRVSKAASNAKVVARHQGKTSYKFFPQQRAQVFVAYAVEDLVDAQRLCETLRRHGCSPWLDKEKLLAGQNWPRAIEQAIEVCDVFVACFSARSIGKRGMFQQEIHHALECARRRPLDDSFLMPVRFEECCVPGRIADQLQYVDLFPDWEKGVRRLARAIRKSARSRPVAGLV
jgi:hypothetical protein